MTFGLARSMSASARPGRRRASALRLYYKPLVLLIWLGAVVMALGGALSLTDRRLRVGAPARAAAAAAIAGRRGVGGCRHSRPALLVALPARLSARRPWPSSRTRC